MKKLLALAVAALGGAIFEGEASTVDRIIMMPQDGYRKLIQLPISSTGGKVAAADMAAKLYQAVPRDQSLANLARVDMVNGIIYILELPMNGWGHNYSGELQTGYIYTYDSSWQARETTGEPFLTVPARGAGSDFLVTSDEKYIFVSVMEGTNQGKILRWTRATGVWDDFATFTSNKDGLRGLAADNSGNLYLAHRSNGKIYRFQMDHEPYAPDAYDAVSSAGDWSALTSPSAVVYCPTYNRIYVAGWTQAAWFDADTLEQGCQPGNLHPDTATYVPGYTTGCFSGGEIYFCGGDGSMNGPIFKLTDYETLAAVDISPVASDHQWRDMTGWQPAIRYQCDFGEAGKAGVAGVRLQAGALGGAAGVVDGALALPNDASTASVVNSKSWLPTTAAWTVALWAHLATGAEGTILSKGGLSLTVNGAGQLALNFGETVIESEITVADDNWHQLNFSRSTTSLELWVDGMQVGSATIAAADAVDQLADLTLGPIAGTAFFDELRVYDTMLSTPVDYWSLAVKVFGSDPPTVPELPTDFAQLDAAVGQQIDHAYANAVSIGAPQLFKYKGNWYLAYAIGETTKIKVSADGQAWADFSTLSATGVSLFSLPSGELGAIGQTSETSAAVWAYDFTGETWQERYAYSGSTAFVIQPNSIINVCDKYGVGVASKSAAFAGADSVGYLFFNTFQAPAGQFNQSSLYWWAAGEASNDQLFGPKYSTIRALLPSVACVDRGQKLSGRPVFETINPIEDADRPDGKAMAGLERYEIQGYNTYWDTQMQYDYSREHRYVALPGAGKAFSLFKDSTTGLYWALTTPVLKAEELADGRAASTIRHRLGLYVSSDLAGWTPCGLVATTGTADTFGYNSPFAVIDGNDLLVAFGVSVDDGVITPATTAFSNYLAVKRIANFRTNYVPGRPAPKKSSVMYATGGRKHGTVYRYYRGPDGEWHADRLLTTKSDTTTPYDGEKPPSFVDSIAVGRRGSVYVTNRSWYWESADDRALRIYRFDADGTFVQMYKNTDYLIDWDAARLALSPDESTLYVSRPTKILKLTVATGEFSTFIDNADGKLGGSAATKSLAVDAQGMLYVADNSQHGKITRFFPSGEQDTSFILTENSWNPANPLDWGAWGIAVDDANNLLYVGCRDGQVWKVNLATQAKTKLCKALSGFGQLDGNAHIDAACNSLAVLDGRLFLSSIYGWVHEIDTETGVQTPAINNSLSVGGIGIFKYEAPGTAWFIR